MDGNSEAKDLVAEFLEQEVSPEPEVVKRSFSPWHKPRKQYVRMEQWCKELRRLIQELNLNGRPISYLGLPGDDMLDIREFHDICQDSGSKLRYLAFNDVKGPRSQRRSRESDLSHMELRSQRYSNIDGTHSHLLLDPLESLGIPEGGVSVAKQHVRELAPYDIVNFDLCNSIARAEPGNVTSVAQALSEVLEIQREGRGEPWLLLLTTRTEREQVRSDVWTLLEQKIEQNADSSPEFLERLRACTGAGAGDVKGVIQSGDFGRVFVVAFCKWLIGLATSGEPSWQPTLTSVFAYRVNRGLDMYSLAFRMERKVKRGHDSTGWTSTDALGAAYSRAAQQQEEVVLALQAIEGVLGLVDVDKLLENDSSLRENVLARAESMMRAARYDSEAYRQWVQNGFK